MKTNRGYGNLEFFVLLIFGLFGISPVNAFKTAGNKSAIADGQYSTEFHSQQSWGSTFGSEDAPGIFADLFIL